MWIIAHIDHPVEAVTATSVRAAPWGTAVIYSDTILLAVLGVLMGNLEGA